MFSILHGIAKGASSAKQVAQGVASHVQHLQRTVASMYVEEDSAVISPDAKKIINTPRIIDLTLSENESDADAPLSFFVFGCGGDGSETQKKVAQMLNDIAGQQLGPRFVIMLGDNFYDNGVDSEHDEAFTKKFYEVYHREDYPYIADLPFFVILGNHDHNLHNNFGLTAGNIHGITDVKKIAAQVLHTHVKDTKNSYCKDNTHLINLPRWNMPSHFYLLRIHNIEMFFIDSNTYVKDFLAMSNGDEDNQAAWLQRNAQNPDTIKLIFMHHPLLTVGKRLQKPDTNVYLNPQDLEMLKSLYNIEGGYNSILRQVLIDTQKLTFNAVFSAHDHDLFYHLDRGNDQTNLCQITVGGGGGRLQNRHTVKDWNKMPFFAKEHGFVNVTITPNSADKKMLFDFHYGLDTYRHVRFDNLSLAPHRRTLTAGEEKAEAPDEFIDKLREVFLISYAEYLNHALQRSEGTAESMHLGEYHGSKGLTSADSLRNLFNNYSPVGGNEIIQIITMTFAERKTLPTPTSLSSIFETNMLKIYMQSFESFIEDYQQKIAGMVREDSASGVMLTPGYTGSPLSFFSVSGDSPEVLVLGAAGALPQDRERRLRLE
jgi:hypothetical protein